MSNTTTIHKIHAEAAKLQTAAEIIAFCQAKRAYLDDTEHRVKLACLAELDRMEAEASNP